MVADSYKLNLLNNDAVGFWEYACDDLYSLHTK